MRCFCCFFFRSTFLGFYPECAATTVFPDSWGAMRNPFQVFSVPTFFPFLFLRRTLFKVPSNKQQQWGEKQNRKLLLHLKRCVSPALLLPCALFQGAECQGSRALWLLLCIQVKIRCPVLGSVVSGTDLSVAGDQKDRGSFQV